MELFDRDGHLTDAALSAFSSDAPLSELERLEIAEHLAFCDQCLMRSMGLFTDEALLSPEHSCRDSIWRRIRMRAVRILASRYATAAAAITIVFTLWGFGVFGGILHGAEQLAAYTPPEHPPVISQRLAEFGETLNDGFIRFSDLFTFGAAGAPHSDS